MEKMTIGEISKAVGGTLISGDPNIDISNICIDSREAKEGSLFVPVIGERVDAHKFIPQVFEQGAAASLTSHDEHESTNRGLIGVEDTVKALGALSVHYRQKFSIPIVGITGSVGKTSTKEMVSAALSAGFKVMKTAGNQNSQIGVPLTLFRIEKDTQAAVVEMGISEYGEMDNLVRFVEPDVAVVTNIGEAHIAQFGKKENTLKEKLKIAKHLTKTQCAFLNGDDPLLSGAADTLNCPVVLYGTGAHCDYRAENIHIEDGKNCFTMVYPKGRVEIVIQQLGQHNVLNALVAMAVACYYGIDPEASKKGLADYEGLPMRQQINNLIDGNKVIDDTYNASPASIRSGVEVLMQLDNSGRKIAVLGDVLELGEKSEAYHYETGVAIAGEGLDLVVTVGNEMKALGRALNEHSPKTEVHMFDSNAEAIEWLVPGIQTGDAILVKGSRGMHEEEVVRALRENYAAHC